MLVMTLLFASLPSQDTVMIPAPPVTVKVEGVAGVLSPGVVITLTADHGP